MTIGTRIKKLRTELRLTQKELARRINVSSQVVSNWERGYTDPSHDDLKLLSEALECSADYILGTTDVRDNQRKSALPKLNAKEERDIAKKLEDILNDLDGESSLAFDGEPIDDMTRELVRVQIESNLRLAKQLAKKKFTPKKFRD